MIMSTSWLDALLDDPMELLGAPQALLMKKPIKSQKLLNQCQQLKRVSRF